MAMPRRHGQRVRPKKEVPNEERLGSPGLLFMKKQIELIRIKSKRIGAAKEEMKGFDISMEEFDAIPTLELLEDVDNQKEEKKDK